MNDARNFGQVADDLQAIFGPGDGSALPPLPPSRSLVEVRRKRGARGGRLLMIGGPLCAAVIAGLTIGYGSVPARSSGPERTAAVRLARVPAVGAPSAMPVAEPTTSALSTIAPGDVMPRSPRSVPSPVPAVLTRTAIAPKPAEQPQAEHSSGAGCDSGSDNDACIYVDVRAADRRLRDAYRHATRAGVSSATLSRIQRRWDRALDLSQDEPDEMIRRYNDLTADLREAAAYEMADRYE